MSRRRRTIQPRANTPRANGPRGVPADLAAPLARVLTVIEDIKRDSRAAGIDPSAEGMDLTPILHLLAEQPRLTEYVNQLARTRAERERAIHDALGGDVFGAGWSGGDHETKASPTGRVAMSGAAWGGKATAKEWRNTGDAVANAGILRRFSMQDEWVRSAINCRRTQVGRADIRVVPLNEMRPYNKTLQRQVQRLLDQPNEARQNWRELVESVLEDILVLDRGVMSKAMTPDRKPAALYSEDGSTIRIFPGWSGKPSEPRYLFVDPDTNEKIPLLNDELICFIDNPATYRLGLSPVQVLKDTIEADLEATKSATAMVKLKPPPHLINLVGAQENQVNTVRNRYDSDIAGRKETFFVGGDAPVHVYPMVFSAKDNQWMEWQEYLARKIAVIFKLSPQQFGATQNNRANGEIQQQIYEDTGLIPLLMLLEEYLNRELLADFAPMLHDEYGRCDLASLNLKIVFPEISEVSRQMHAERAVQLATKAAVGLPSMTINELIALRGGTPVPGGNTFYVNTSLGPVPWLSYDGKVETYNTLPEQSLAASANGAPAAPKKPQPGKPKKPHEDDAVGSGGDNAPAKPAAAKSMAATNAATSMDADDAALSDYQRSIVYDGRLPGRPWTPSTRAWTTVLDAAADDTPTQ